MTEIAEETIPVGAEAANKQTQEPGIRPQVLGALRGVMAERGSSDTGKKELPSVEIRKTLDRWRNWMENTMMIKRGTDAERTHRVAERREMTAIALQVIGDLLRSGVVYLSEEVLRDASYPALYFAIKDFDPDGSESFEASVRRKVKLCLESLPTISSPLAQSTMNIANESIHVGSSTYRAQKYLIHAKQKPDTAEKEQRFIQWVAAQSIPGETYEECILTSMIRFMPALLAHVAREFPTVKGMDRTSLVQSFSGNLIRILITYDPSYDSNFYRYAMVRIQTPTRFLSQRRRNAKPTFSTRSNAARTESGKATDYRTETGKTDSASELGQRPMSQLQRRREDARLKDEAKKKRSKGNDDAPKTPSELEADALAEKQARENRVIACVQTYIEGGNTVVNYADALRVLQSTQQSRAQRFGKTHLVKHCRDEVPKPEPKKLESASRTLLAQAIESFDPPDDTKDHFGAHLAKVINTGILTQYQQR